MSKTFKLNGVQVPFRTGQTILEVAQEQQVKIPTLCHLAGTQPTGHCRICVVEVAGSNTLLPACSTPAGTDMQVLTQSPAVIAARKAIIAMMITSGAHNCLVMDSSSPNWSANQLKIMQQPWHNAICPSHGHCMLQDLAIEYGVNAQGMEWNLEGHPLDDVTPMIVRDYSRCIGCGRCVQACNEIQVNNAIPSPYGRRTDRPRGWYPLVDYDHCTHCGQCLQVCPVGALFEKKAFGQTNGHGVEMVRTTCPYCGVGCQQWLHVKDGKIVKVTGVEGAEPNQGRLCVKGRFGYDFIYSEERLKTPLIREGDTFREASWDEALDLVAEKFKEIIAAHGPDALAGVSCARSINEDSYQMQKLFRAVIGTNNIDHCARSCHAPTVAGLAAAFGSGAMTNSFEHFTKPKLFFVIGSNTTEAHPVASTFIKQAVRQGAEMIVVDPRRTQIAEFAGMHLPLKVGTDVALLNGIMNVLIDESLYNENYVESCTTGFDQLRDKVMQYTPEMVAEITAIPARDIRLVARKLASVKPCMLIYTLGITEHTCGVNNVLSCANLQMLLGNVGFECGGVNPLRGQNNVQGACDMGALPNVLPGYQKVDDRGSREKFESFWGGLWPGAPGLMIPDMITGLSDGRIKGFYIFGENLANTEPDIRHVEHCLQSAEFLVCQDIFPNETTRFAHVVLPAAAWSEDDGTFTNSERRVSRVRKVSEPPGMARPNWWIFREIAERFGHHWASCSGRELWDNEISVLAPQFAGIKFRRIEQNGLQWPVPDEDHPGTALLHKDGCFTCGLGRFHAVEWTAPAETPDAEYPFTLSTGRRLYHYHTRTQTGRCEGLNELLPEETVDISVPDAEQLGIEQGESILVKSRRGEVEVTARITGEVPPGLVWMAFHFRKGNANWLTNPVFDPVSKTAEYKACAVRLEKLPHCGVRMASGSDGL